MVDAVVGILGSTGDPRVALLMRWMSGSTYLVDGPAALAEACLGTVLLSIAFATRRWLNILTLGPSPSAAVGIPLARSRQIVFAMIGAALIGGAVMVTANFLSRTIVSPYQIPAEVMLFAVNGFEPATVVNTR